MSTSHYPTLDAYLRSLPNGIESFPDWQVKRDSLFFVRRELGKHELSGLPESLRRCLDENQADKWIPDAGAVALALLYRDVGFSSDRQFLAAFYELNAELFKSPFYRVVMKVLSPTLVAIGSAKRWRAFRSAGELRTEPVRVVDGRKIVDVTLQHIPTIYAPLYLKVFAEAFKAAIDIAGAEDSRAEITKTGPSATHYRVSWKG